MSARTPNAILHNLHRLVAARATQALSDRDLLDRFAAHRDEAAFAALVERHGAMVLGVCRRVLRNAHDAEDASQAAFLVLARKAAAIRKQESLACWLHAVAAHVAANLWRGEARRGTREAARPAAAQPDAAAEVSWREVQGLIDEELARLPGHYRAPLVLCYLEGKTRDEAAQQLGWNLATLRGRLERARERLRARLARRGLTLSAALLAGALAEGSLSAALPAAFVVRTVQAGHAGASARALALTDDALKALSAARAKVRAGILAAVLAVGLGVGLVATSRPGAEPSVPALAQEQEPARTPVEAADWPQWRGPNRDGVVQGVTVPAKWPRTLREEWTVPVGKGVASPVVAGGKLYVFTRQKDDEFLTCLDLAGGKEHWRSEPYPAPYKAGPGEGTADDRPRSTPAVSGGRVYTLGMTGILSCLDAQTGKLLWRKDTRYAPYMGSSPLVADGLCIAHVGDGAKAGGLTAFDAGTGDVRWCFSEGYSAMSGSPILVDLAGERQLVTYSAWNPAGVAAATGQKLWGVGPGGGGMPCTTPVQYKDLLILADNLDSLRALRLEKGDRGIKAKEVWKAKGDLKLYYSSPVVVGDLVFGMSTRNMGCFFCLDANSGKLLWESDARQGGYASIVSLGSVLLILKDRGQLLVVRPSATAFEPIADSPSGNCRSPASSSTSRGHRPSPEADSSWAVATRGCCASTRTGSRWRAGSMTCAPPRACWSSAGRSCSPSTRRSGRRTHSSRCRPTRRCCPGRRRSNSGSRGRAAGTSMPRSRWPGIGCSPPRPTWTTRRPASAPSSA
jgi:RNA polymerase sigma factor (sigma-70 family)